MKPRELEKPLKAIANRRRLAILAYLKRENEAPVNFIAKEIELSFRSTSRHLAILFLAEIIERRQSGLEMLYRIAPNQNPVVKRLLDSL
jgi:DNA-binding transcriptional ArsR family regulator